MVNKGGVLVLKYGVLGLMCPARQTFDGFNLGAGGAKLAAIFFAGFLAMKASRAAPATKLVVVIEDDALVLEATGSLLRSWGFQVVTAESYGEAMDRLGKPGRRPDLIVCDYRLSEGATGVDAIKRLRSAFEIPALLISGDASSPQFVAGTAAYQLLHKPVNAETFRAALVDSSVLQP